MPSYRLARLTDRVRVPVPGGKTIEEIFGRMASGGDRFSLAHMVAPAGWSEPRQKPEFGELTLVVRGRMRLELDGETLELGPGEALWLEPGHAVRYSNPGTEESEYYALCLPAFTPERARREAS